MRWYEPVPSPPELDTVLACSWTAVPTGRHQLVPDACMDLVWLSDGRALLCGPETTAWHFELPRGTTAVGVRFRPGVASALFAVSAADVADTRRPLGDVIGNEAERRLLDALDQVHEPAHTSPGLTARRVAMEHFVAAWVSARAACVDLTLALGFSERILNTLATTPRANAGHVARQSAMTARQLHRRSLVSFGYGTSTLARLLRFQRFLALAEARARPHRLALLAIEAGYTDQAHLGRDCRGITGRTPAEFLTEYFPTFPDMSDPYKTAGAFAVTMTA